MDDDSVMQQLANALDMDSMAMRLTRMGVAGEPRECGHRLFTSNDAESLLITVEGENRFLITWPNSDRLYDDLITTWDEWILFVRLLNLRIMQKKKTAVVIKPVDQQSTGSFS